MTVILLKANSSKLLAAPPLIVEACAPEALRLDDAGVRSGSSDVLGIQARRDTWVGVPKRVVPEIAVWMQTTHGTREVPRPRVDLDAATLRIEQAGLTIRDTFVGGRREVTHWVVLQHDNGAEALLTPPEARALPARLWSSLGARRRLAAG